MKTTFDGEIRETPGADDAPPQLRRSRAAYQALWGTGIASDVLVWTASQFNSRVHLEASLPATVIREGKLLQAALEFRYEILYCA